MADETGAKYCMISHMRGKVADMDKIEQVCKDRGIVLLGEFFPRQRRPVNICTQRTVLTVWGCIGGESTPGTRA